MILFHGACHGCTQQDHGFDTCKKCQNMTKNYDDNDLCNAPITQTEIIRRKLLLEKEIDNITN